MDKPDIYTEEEWVIVSKSLETPQGWTDYYLAEFYNVFDLFGHCLPIELRPEQDELLTQLKSFLEKAANDIFRSED